METDIDTELDSGKRNSIHKRQNYAHSSKKLQCLDGSPILLMGILNCTPDSFYDAGQYMQVDAALKHGQKMIEEGADILDIGGVSSRPDAEDIPEEVELQRVMPVLKELAPFALSKNVHISIDTTRGKVAENALNLGASFINDISGLTTPHMRELVKDSKVATVLMHMQGNPKTMQKNPNYPQGVVSEVTSWFKKNIQALEKEGIDPSQLILDPGIGFGKTVKDNLLLLENLSQFQQFGRPLLIGLSRKSFMSKILKKRATELLSTTIALNTMSILKGASIIRVHDVKEHRDVIDVMLALKENELSLHCCNNIRNHNFNGSS